MSSKVFCYLRTLRRQWGLTQEEVASLLPKGDRNRVSDVERGRALPNAEEIVAYAVIFGLCAREMFPRYYFQVEEAVMIKAYALSEALQSLKSPIAEKKCDLVEEMLARATGKTRTPRV
ncbi:MAG: helix-turn-helix transcriptional regulator [Alphaproteobacteria bacterium]|nr:helix-turn-helix transcriptional regulator [Alphaproteobacteria bacterium]